MTATSDFSEVRSGMEALGAASVSDHFLTYIRPVEMGEGKGKGFAVCTEDGVQLAVFGSHEAAFFSARQHNLTPVSVH